jgi:hypothetical protein
LLNWLKPRGRSAALGADATAALERIIEGVDPRLGLAGRYRKRLAAPAARALDFARELVAKLPEPLALRAEAWSGDAQLRAFFATAKDVRDVVSRGPEPRAFFEGPGAMRDDAFAVLGMTRKQQTVLAQALEGERVRRDVPRVSVSFTDHRLASPSATEPELRRALEARVLDFIAARAAARLGELDERRKGLEHERDVLKARLRLAGSGAKGAEPAAGEADLKARLAANEARLREARAALGSLDDRVALVAEMLAAPEKELEVAVHTLRLDQMNFVVDAGAEAAAVTFVEATAAGGETSRVLVPVRVFRSELGPKGAVLADAERYL